MPPRKVWWVLWEDFTAAATEIKWFAYMATADAAGLPHVAPVAPGFTAGAVWFATRSTSKKWRNVLVNPEVGFHWPVGSGSGPGELAAWGRVIPHTGPEERERISGLGIFRYDLAGFFGSIDNPDLVFGEAVIRRARLLGPDHRPKVWTPSNG